MFNTRLSDGFRRTVRDTITDNDVVEEKRSLSRVFSANCCVLMVMHTAAVAFANEELELLLGFSHVDCEFVR